MSAWFQGPPCFYPWPSVVYSQHNSERGSFKPKSHSVFLMSPSSLSSMPSTMRSCSYSWTSSPPNLSLPCAPTTLAFFLFFYTHTPEPRQVLFLSIWKALSDTHVTYFPFSFRYLLNVLRPAFTASPPPCGIAFHSPPTAHPGTPCPSYLTLFFPL